MMAKFPGAEAGSSLPCGRLKDTVFRLAEEIEATLSEEIDCEGETSDAISQDAVPYVSATCVVAGERRRLLPGFTSASRVLIVAFRKCLTGSNPEALEQEQRKHHRGDALWQVEMKSADAGESVGHQAGEQTFPV